MSHRYAAVDSARESVTIDGEKRLLGDLSLQELYRALRDAEEQPFKRGDSLLVYCIELEIETRTQSRRKK